MAHKPLKKLFIPHLNKTFVFGCKMPKVLGPHFRLERYLGSVLPAPPTSCDYTKAALVVIAQMYLNNTLGDCVIAEDYHFVGVETGNVGDLFSATDAQVELDYEKIGGYVPGNESTDNGCDPVTDLNYRVANGFADGTRLLGWLTANAQNQTIVMQAIELFENVKICICLPDAWINPVPSASGFVWDVAGDPDPENGHCIGAYGYTAQGVIISTWGMLGIITWAALAKYAVLSQGGSVFVRLTPDQLAKGATKAPNGFLWSTLVSDFDTMGGTVPVPAPPTPTPTPPTPVPPAPPSPIVSLAQAIAWADKGLGALPSVMLRAQAEQAVSKALTANWPAQHK